MLNNHFKQFDYQKNYYYEIYLKHKGMTNYKILHFNWTKGFSIQDDIQLLKEKTLSNSEQ